MPNLDMPAWEALDCAKRFDHFGLELPADAARWVAKLVELQQNRPEPPPRNQVAMLIAESADEADIDAAIMRHVGNHHRFQQHGEAETLCGRRVLAAVRSVTASTPNYPAPRPKSSVGCTPQHRLMRTSANSLANAEPTRHTCWPPPNPTWKNYAAATSCVTFI